MHGDPVSRQRTRWCDDHAGGGVGVVASTRYKETSNVNPTRQNQGYRRMKAAIFRELEKPLSIEEVEIDQPGPHEVLIRTVASGVCHSDLHCLHGTLPTKTPAILG